MSDLANQQVFPVLDNSERADYGDGAKYHHQSIAGMTFRQYAAVEAMKGLLSNPSIIQPDPMCGWRIANMTESQLADYAVHLADCQIAQLERPSPLSILITRLKRWNVKEENGELMYCENEHDRSQPCQWVPFTEHTWKRVIAQLEKPIA